MNKRAPGQELCLWGSVVILFLKLVMCLPTSQQTCLAIASTQLTLLQTFPRITFKPKLIHVWHFRELF